MRAFLWILALAVAGSGCGGDDESESSTGGKTGSGGTGASSGGKSGSGGSSGTGATSSGGGTGGTSASGGTGGSAGSIATGGTAGSIGSGGAAGSSGTGGAAGGTGVVCGGKIGKPCQVGEYCDFANDSCGLADQTGECKVAMSCGVSCTPVCGCDGNSYCNSCIANLHGTDAIAAKTCVPGNGETGAACFIDADCKSGFKCCRDCGAIDCPQSCTAVAAGAMCPALP